MLNIVFFCHDLCCICTTYLLLLSGAWWCCRVVELTQCKGYPPNIGQDSNNIIIVLVFGVRGIKGMDRGRVQWKSGGRVVGITLWFWPILGTAGLIPSRRTKKWFPKKNERATTNKRKGYDKYETTFRKLSAMKIQLYWVYFCVIHYWPLTFKTCKNRVPTKIIAAESDSSRWILLCRGLGFRPFWRTSVCSDFFLLLGKSRLCACTR